MRLFLMGLFFALLLALHADPQQFGADDAHQLIKTAPVAALLAEPDDLDDKSRNLYNSHRLGEAACFGPVTAPERTRQQADRCVWSHGKPPGVGISSVLRI